MTRLTLAACVALTILGIALRLAHLDVLNRTPDEGDYTTQATLIAHHGTVAGERLVDQYNRDREMWRYPPPIRVGYLYLIAGVMKLSHSGDPRVVAWVSCAASVLLLFAVGWIAVRFFNPTVAFVALALASVSPMSLAMARRAWQDEVLACVALWMVAVCCEVRRRPQSTSWLALLWLLGGYCLLIKESAIVVYGLCCLWLLWIFWFRERSVKRTAQVVVFAALGIAVALTIVAMGSGGFAKVLTVVRNPSCWRS